MNALDLYFDIKKKYGLSNMDMANLFGVSISTIEKWLSGEKQPLDFYGELVQIEEEIIMAANCLKKYKELNDFCAAHFKGAINLLDIRENL